LLLTLGAEVFSQERKYIYKTSTITIPLGLYTRLEISAITKKPSIYSPRSDSKETTRKSTLTYTKTQKPILLDSLSLSSDSLSLDSINVQDSLGRYPNKQEADSALFHWKSDLQKIAECIESKVDSLLIAETTKVDIRRTIETVVRQESRNILYVGKDSAVWHFMQRFEKSIKETYSITTTTSRTIQIITHECVEIETKNNQDSTQEIMLALKDSTIEDPIPEKEKKGIFRKKGVKIALVVVAAPVAIPVFIVGYPIYLLIDKLSNRSSNRSFTIQFKIKKVGKVKRSKGKKRYKNQCFDKF